MSAKKNHEKQFDKLVRLTAEADQQKAEINEIVAGFKTAIASGDYSKEQAKADIAEMGLPESEAAELLAMLDD